MVIWTIVCKKNASCSPILKSPDGRLYGDKLVLKGNLHTTKVMLFGSVQDVVEASKRAIDDAAAGGKVYPVNGGPVWQRVVAAGLGHRCARQIGESKLVLAFRKFGILVFSIFYVQICVPANINSQKSILMFTGCQNLCQSGLS